MLAAYLDWMLAEPQPAGRVYRGYDACAPSGEGDGLTGGCGAERSAAMQTAERQLLL